MNLTKDIKTRLKAFFDKTFLRDTRVSNYFCGWHGKRLAYSRVIFKNICDILTDLCNDVTFTNVAGKNNMLFVEFKSFFEREGQSVLNRLFRSGYVVIMHKVGVGFYVGIESVDYAVQSSGAKNVINKLDTDASVYVMRSDTYIEDGISDYDLLYPFLSFLDDTLNASATISARLGTVVVASPKNLTSAPTETILTQEEKKELEEEMSSEYGSLRNQSQVMLLPREMSFTTINLAGLDVKTESKARLAVLAIADRIKVPANQIAMIDANSSKSLSNGTELREGDYNKYQSFERLLQHTFVNFAKSIGLAVDYSIYNKPTRGQI